MLLNHWRGGMLCKPDSGAGEGGMPEPGAASNGDGGTPAPELTFDAWYGALDDKAKGLFDNHVTGLKAALNTERDNRAALSKQIKDLAAKAEKGSELEKQLSEASQKLEQAERRAEFMADALRPEIGCSNAKAAYALAVADDLFDRHGRPDWNTLKSLAPELFRKPGLGSADGGAGAQQAPKMDMNALIRRAAGRG